MYSEKLDKVRALIENNSPGSFATFVEKVKSLGGTDDASLAEITAIDLQYEPFGLPLLLARKVAKIFQGITNDNSPHEVRQIVVMDDDPEKLAMRLTPAELIEQFDPYEPDSAWGRRLNQISAGYKFLVFSRNGDFLRNPSLKCLEELREGYDERLSIVVNGQVIPTYSVGNIPNRYASENPVRPGTKLRPDGFSDDNVEWGRLDIEIRRLICLAASGENPEVDLKKHSEAEIFDRVEGKTFDEIGKMFPKAAIRYQELEGEENLPSLKIKLQPRKLAKN